MVVTAKLYCWTNPIILLDKSKSIGAETYAI